MNSRVESGNGPISDSQSDDWKPGNAERQEPVNEYSPDSDEQFSNSEEMAKYIFK